MGTLAGTKVKDAYTSLLKLESGVITTSTKVVEDGAGNDSALKISSSTVEVAGTLKFGTAPTAGSSETSALLLDSNNNVVKRTLGTAAFTTGESNTGTAPIAVSGSNVISLNAPTTLSQLTESTVAIADSFFIYDASATAHKYITIQDLKDYVTTGVTAAAGGSNTQIQFNNSGSLSGSSIFTFSTSTLFYGGDSFVIREPSSGSASTALSSESATIANSATNQSLFTVPNLSTRGAIIDYVIYNSGETRKRVGTLAAVWNTQDATVNPAFSDSVLVQLGTSTTSEFTFTVVYIDDAGLFHIRASNSVGETMYFRASVKLLLNAS